LNEIEIELSEVNPQDFFGEQNKTIEHLRAYFPKIKIIARGNKLKALGEEEILEEFEKRVDMLVAHFGKFNSLDQATIELILTADGSKDY
jgi:phosphate starvation-inducible PhoH-like protein